MGAWAHGARIEGDASGPGPRPHFRRHLTCSVPPSMYSITTNGLSGSSR